MYQKYKQTNYRGSMQKLTSVSNLQIMCQKYQTYLCIKMSKKLFKVIRYFHMRRSRGEEEGPDVPLKNHKNIGLLEILLSGTLGKSRSYKAIGVSLAGR